MDSFISDDDDELHYKPATGTHIETFGDRSIEERRHFVMGLEHGVRTRYWPDGRSRARSNYKDGLKEGVAKSWHFNGKIATRRNFTMGKLIGEVERWSEAGEYQPASAENRESRSKSEQSVENDHGWLRTRCGRYGKYYDSRSGCLAEGDYATYFDNGKIEYKVTSAASLA
jgi:antitoxin component YwqK of YwqJK toxin-antitoxin module